MTYFYIKFIFLIKILFLDIIPDENQKKKINQTNTSNMKDNSKSKEDIDILENDKTMK